MSLERRIARVEQAAALARARRQYRMMAATAAEYRLTAAQLFEEARVFFRLSLEDQLAEIDRCTDALGAEGLDVDEIKSTLIRENKPL